MSRKDRIKSQIDYIKALIIILITALFTITGWIVTIKNKADKIDFILVGFGFLFLAFAILFFNKKINVNFNELEKED